MSEIQMIIEAYNSEPRRYKVGKTVSDHDPRIDKDSAVIDRIVPDTARISTDCEKTTLRGFDKDGNILFDCWADSMNVIYKAP